MLKDFRPLAVLLTISLAVGTAASAQSLRNVDQPAEIPPASYTGKQYVDSKGCVFVRAGFDGAVTWVPRVNRQRGLLCGAQPTFANQPVPAPEPTIAPAPTVIAVATPTVRPAATARIPVQMLPRVAKPAPVQPRRVVQAPIYKSIKPTPVQHAPVYIAPVKVADASGCPYVSSTKHNVRCGPQADHPGNYATGYDGGYTGIASTGVIHVRPAPAITPPPGYRAAFDDGRFNPNRGKQTHEGYVQMRLVWTSGTPRRLIDQNTDRDVTRLFPGLKWPFLTYKKQRDYVVINQPPVRHAGVTYATKNVVPTSAVVAAAPVARNGHRFVQVGTFRDEGNVQSAVARLRALGLPARTGSFKKNGSVYRVVLAGPYGDGGQLNAGLTAARRGGFPDAFTRK